ncbi:hypothetical protein EON80_31660 [bacterium]|nr:MAG: hypothetical protein EON80_31660 [bacterium]
MLFLSPALVTSLSGCNNGNCDNNRSTLTTADDCGPGGRSAAGGRVISGGGRNFGSGEAAPRSGGFGGFGRFFSGGG